MTTETATAPVAEQSSMPSSEAAPSIETAQQSAQEKSESTRSQAVDNAFDKVFGDDNAMEKGPVARDEKGRFASSNSAETQAAPPIVPPPPTLEQPAASPNDAPARFSADAKAAWAATPDPVKAEINRGFSEMEKGIQEYQTKYAGLKPYEEMAQQYGTTVEAALQNYTNMENLLANNPAQAFGKICEYIGKTPQQFIAELTGQQQQQQAPQEDQGVISNLRQQIAQMQQQIGTVNQSIEQQRDAAAEQQLQVWAATKPRFNELRDTMTKLVQGGMASDLDNAYAQAERLIPAIAPVAQAQAPKPDLKAQTQKGQLSTTGAPVSGSNPAFRKPASSNAEAVDRAFAQLGLG